MIGQPRNLAPRYNIAPTTQIEVIRLAENGQRAGADTLGPCAIMVGKALQQAACRDAASFQHQLQEQSIRILGFAGKGHGHASLSDAKKAAFRKLADYNPWS
ncbi:SOS response-associated peptidase [Methylocystis suflitae]|uniref:SOS response-associated peptidase n=1 Tax=Methylocystis suflitae TaxID=2951405 RepID=UPI00210AB09A|nr:SOS response-associated peptidase [Methylocystis suflitae]MCQ4190108.1 SOS response-associated peptidase [Methylocystis suflitae]